MAFKIYTKTGDEGLTGLIGGTRIPKSHLRIEAYGTVDELNSWIGYLGDLLQDEATKPLLKEIQDRLFTIGSSLACDPEKETKMSLPDLNKEDIQKLEEEMDRMETFLPVLKNFVLPGGHIAASAAHITRCVCRRAERICVHLQQEKEFVDANVLIYLNRLSDYFFMLSRYILIQSGGTEIPWIARESRS